MREAEVVCMSLFELAGLVLVVAGVALFSVPAAVIAAGVALFVVGWRGVDL